MMIGEENLAYGPHARLPWIPTQKAGEVKMQDFRVITANDPAQLIFLPVSVGRFGENIQSDVWQVEKAPHLFSRLAEKTKHAFPAALAELC